MPRLLPMRPPSKRCDGWAALPLGTCSPSAQLPRVNVVLVQLNKALSIKTSNLPAPLSRNAHPRARLALLVDNDTFVIM